MEYVWMVSADGVPWRIPIVEEPKCQSQVEWEPVPCSVTQSIRTIAACSKSAFALDRSGKVLMLVLPTHIALRQKVEVYVNQRWYPLVKWRRPLPTDRAEYSDETGRQRRDLEFFEQDVASDGWNWEEPWRTAQDPRIYDDDGWQYSVTFMGAKWERQCRRHHFVRRKVLRRHMRFTKYDKWIELSDDDSKMFVEITCGGADIMEEGELLLFALGTDGDIYRRRGIRNDVPNGVAWIEIPRIVINNDDVVDDITLLTMSPTLATLICITWDGKMFHRRGVSRVLPSGASWQQVATPRNRAVINVAVGTDTIWCITADGQVWYCRVEIEKKRKEHLMHKITETSWHEVVRSGICRLSLTKNDQVFAVESHKEMMEVRTGVQDSEPSGRKFEQVVDRADQQRWISIHAGSTSLNNIPKYFLDSRVLQAKQEILEFKKADWRLKILESLQIANDTSWSTMKDVKIEKFGDDYEQVDRWRKIKCQQVVAENKMRNVVLKITDALIEIESDEAVDKTLDCSTILSAFCGFQRLPQKYLLHLLVKNETKPMSFAFGDEPARNTFQDIIDNIIRSFISASVRSSIGQSMWTVSEGGSVRWHCLSEMNTKLEEMVPLSESRSLMIQGNFESIDCGANRLVWAVNYAGDLYTLHPKFDPLSSLDHNFEYRQTDELVHNLYEYQKTAIFRGFVTFQGQQKGISAWMSNDNNQAAPQFYSSLASKHWTWLDSEWQLEMDQDGGGEDDESWEYSNEIDGNYAIGVRNEGKYRRRLWRRRAKFETNKSAWCRVEGPPIRLVRVGKCENERATVCVVALTKHGHILLRTNVSRQNFTGDTWSQIVTDSPTIAIHLQSSSNQQLWCLSSDSLIMSISITSSDDETTTWKHLPINLTARKITLPKSETHIDLTGANDIVYLRTRNVLFRIDTVYLTCSDPYPMDNLKQAVVNSKGQICLLGSNVSIVNEWKIVPYDDNKTTIIQPKSMNRAMNFGKSIICICMY